MPDFDPGMWVGLTGGGIFFSSWLLQAYETRRAGQPVVSWRFFGLRLCGSVLLLVESLRVMSPGLIAVNGATALLMTYNLYMAGGVSRPPPPDDVDPRRKI